MAASRFDSGFIDWIRQAPNDILEKLYFEIHVELLERDVEREIERELEEKFNDSEGQE